jgi:hypothetical protein
MKIMAIVSYTKKLFSDLRVQVFIVIAIILVTIALLQVFKVFSGPDFNFFSDVIGFIAPFIATIFIVFRHKDKKNQTDGDYEI